MKQFFSGKLYLQALRKVRTLGIAMLICITALNLFLPIMGISRNYALQDVEYVIKNEEDIVYSYTDMYRPRITEIEDIGFAPFLWALVFFAPLLVYVMFSFLQERRQSDFYHALPQKRVCVYLSMIAAVMTWLAGTVVISTLLNTLLWSFAKLYTFTVWTVLGNLVFYTVLSFFVASFMALASTVTGTPTSAVLAFGFLTLFPRYAILLFKSALEDMCSILVHTRDMLSLWSFDRWIVTAWWDGFAQDGFFSDPAVLVYSLIASLVVFAAAGFCYHIRRSESAGRSAPNAVLQHVYRILFTSAAAIALPFAIIMDGIDDYVFLLLLLVFVVYVLYELMTVKKIRSMLRSLKLIWVPFVVCFAFAGSVFVANALVYSIRPEADEVESVAFLDLYGNTTGCYGERLIYLNSCQDPEVIALCVDALHGVLDDEYRHMDRNAIDISYRLKNGRTIDRHLSVPVDFWEKVITSDALRDTYFALPESYRKIDITPFPIPNDTGSIKGQYEMMQETVWNTFVSEYESLTDAEKLRMIRYSDNYGYRWDGFVIRLTVEEPSDRYGTWEMDFRYVLTPDLVPRTVEMLLSLYGTDEEILSYLEGLKAETYGNTIYVWSKSQTGYRYISTTADRLFRNVSLDSHLFVGTPNTLIEIKGIYVWVNLTESEVYALYDSWETPIDVKVDKEIAYKCPPEATLVVNGG
ncbi:MAG: hypothetical protein IJV98_09110 [Clostridia bacterium]|nr:hypothetical protein [Clostridia bacterium]